MSQEMITSQLTSQLTTQTSIPFQIEAEKNSVFAEKGAVEQEKFGLKEELVRVEQEKLDVENQLAAVSHGLQLAEANCERLEEEIMMLNRDRGELTEQFNAVSTSGF